MRPISNGIAMAVAVTLLAGAAGASGEFLLGPAAGPFNVIPVKPSISFDIIGFRCDR